MFNHMEYAPISEKIVLNDNLTVVFHPNSHVVGATSISLIIRKPNNSVKHILFSSDMGSKINKEFQPFLKEMDMPRKCNLFISEATYNDKSRQMTRQDCITEREELKRLIKESISQNKRVLFATFSFARGQLLLSMLRDWYGNEEWFQQTPIIVDGLLINKINDTYLNVLEDEDKKYFRSVLNMRNIKFNKTYDGTLATLSKRTSGIYLAGSGFLTNGRITTYLPQFLGSSKDVIILTGYCGGEGSLGYKIMDATQKTVTIDKKVILKRAKVVQLKTFSSHISYQELLDLWASMDCDKIIVHHSEESGKNEMVQEAKEYLRSKNKTTPIVAVNKKCASQFVL